MKDVLVVSHERSGTHLTINIIGLPMKNVPIEGFGLIEDMNITNYIVDNKFGGIWKSHHQSTYFDMEKLLKNVKIVYVYREIKDVLTSCWFYYKNNQVFNCKSDINKWIFEKPKFKDIVDPYCKEDCVDFVDRYLKQINSWKMYEDDIMMLKFEDIINDFDGVRMKLIEYLDINIRKDKPKLNESSVFPRKGIIGDYKNHMTKYTIDKINNTT